MKNYKITMENTLSGEVFEIYGQFRDECNARNRIDNIREWCETIKSIEEEVEENL